MSDRSASRVDDAFKQYLKEISQAVDDGNADADQVIASALEELSGKEVIVATDIECSRFLESLITSSSPSQALELLGRIASRDALYTVACNPFGSHVLERLLVQVQEALGTERQADAYQMIDQVVQLVKDDVVDYTTHKFGTFFARRLLQLLVGQLSAVTVTNPDSGGKKQDIAQKIQALRSRADDALKKSTSTAHSVGAVDPSFRVHVDTFVNVFSGAGFDEESIFNLQRSSYGSPFLQALLSAPLDMSQKERLVCQMLGVAPAAGESLQSALGRLDAASIISQMKHKTASHTIEAVFMNCPPSIYTALWSCLEPKFESLCLNPISNFAAQSLIAAAPEARYIGDIFHNVKGSLADLITRGRSGVACVLIAACAAWHIECEACCTAVEAVFPDGALPGLAMLGQESTLEDASASALSAKRPPRLSVNGCIILQALLAMPQKACGKISDAVLALPSSQLGYLAQDPSGARVLEMLLKGSTPKGLKRKMLLSLEQYYVRMSKLGAASRLVEALFTWAGIPEKEVIAQSLVGSFSDLQGTKYGAPLCEICMLELYKNSPETWRRRMSSSEKMQAQYEKLFSDSAVSKSKAKRKATKKAASEHRSDGRDSVRPSNDFHTDTRQRATAGKASKTVAENGASEVSKRVMEQLGIGMPDDALRVKRAKTGLDSSVKKERAPFHGDEKSTKKRKSKKRIEKQQ